MDEQHDTPCGQAVKKLCERANQIYDETRYENLANISVSHLYNLRASTSYQKQRRTFEKTKSKQCSIGERRKTEPNGQPGYIRIDTVHQGDQDKQKGVYHINTVNQETQFEVACSVEKISERFLMPILEQLLDKFPFKIISFHSDNGSEHVNRHVAKLLKELLIEFTKSRSRWTNDNALPESKNASIVRKNIRLSAYPTKMDCRIKYI
jgi:transposase InsO family protein